MEVFRLCRQQYTKVLNGKGAAHYGARWNSAGTELIYTACNRSLAMAEVMVHMSLAMLPEDYYLMTILIPDELEISEITTDKLAEDWNSFPYSVSTRSIGDRFVIQQNSCVLKVPSAVTKGDFNYLINPHHSDFDKIKVTALEKFPFDRRIFR